MLLLLPWLFAGYTYGQCSCYNCPVALPDVLSTTFTADVVVHNSSNNQLGVNNTLEQVCIDIVHDWIGDLDITLTAPDGTSVILFADGNSDASLGGNEEFPFGNSSDNMEVCFVLPGGATNIFGTTGSGTCTTQAYYDPCNGTDPCFTGNWGTWDEGCLGGQGIGAFNNGTGTVSGTWMVSVNDNAGANQGYIQDVTLVFATAPDSCSTIPPPAPALCGNTTDVPIPDTGAPVQSAIMNTGSSGSIGNGTAIVSVCVLIQHTWLSDLDLYLYAPDGSSIELSTDNGSLSDNYGNVATGEEVCFTPSAVTSITSYSGGQTGDWLPEGNFLDFDSPANGTWTLQVSDDLGGDVGQILSWSIEFSNGDCANGCTFFYEREDDFCAGSGYPFFGNTLSSAGTYTDTADIGGGCDSVVVLTLSEQSVPLVPYDAFICPGDSFSITGVNFYSTTGVYYDTLASSAGCDSIIKLSVIVGGSNPLEGLYGATATGVLRLNPLTGATIASPGSGFSTGWINAAFTVHQQGGILYWITDAYELRAFNLNTNTVSTLPTGLGALPFFYGLCYYDGYLYTLTASGDYDKLLIRLNPATGAIDAGFPGIELSGTAAYNLSVGATLAANPLTGKLYLPVLFNGLLEFDPATYSGGFLSLSGALPTPGFVDLLVFDENTGDMYGLANYRDVVKISLTGPGTASASLVKSLTGVSGYTNPAVAFDSGLKRYVFQAAAGCGSSHVLLALDVSSGQEWCSDPPLEVLYQLHYLNCSPSSGMRTSGNPR